MVYASNLREFEIYHDGSLWRIGTKGELPDRLKGGYMSIVECERALIGYLEGYRKAIYPNSPYVRKVTDASRTGE